MPILISILRGNSPNSIKLGHKVHKLELSKGKDPPILEIRVTQEIQGTLGAPEILKTWISPKSHQTVITNLSELVKRALLLLKRSDYSTVRNIKAIKLT